MNILIMHKQRRLVLIVAAIGIIVAAFGTVSSGNSLWLSLMAPLALIIFALMVKTPGNNRSNAPVNNQPVAPTINKLEEMIKLIEQRDKGDISDEEYREKRENLIYYS